jgi:hypothetical protein
MKGKLIWSIFWALVVVFVIIVSMIFIPQVNELLVGEENPTVIGFGFFISAGVVLIGLGVTLIVLTVKQKIEGNLNKLLLLTGASTAGLPVFVVLHNVISGLTDFEEPVFFTLATIVCPIAFLAGVIGTTVLTIKNKPPKYSGQNV